MSQNLTPSDPSASADPVAAWREVKAQIAQTEHAAGRTAGDVTLVAVSKQQEWARIAPVLAAGQRVFGENRVQEAQSRWGEVRLSHADLELRLIGPLQTNKAADAVALQHHRHAIRRIFRAKSLFLPGKRPIQPVRPLHRTRFIRQ